MIYNIQNIFLRRLAILTAFIFLYPIVWLAAFYDNNLRNCITDTNDDYEPRQFRKAFVDIWKGKE